MKYICLGYVNEKEWDARTAGDGGAAMNECFAYDDVLRKNGHYLGGEALESARNTTTLQWRDGKTFVSDGPFTETKEQLGGIIVLEAPDLNRAIQLISEHPSIRMGARWEIRPAICRP